VNQRILSIPGREGTKSPFVHLWIAALEAKGFSIDDFRSGSGFYPSVVVHWPDALQPSPKRSQGLLDRP
jgi:hypothetical protein